MFKGVKDFVEGGKSNFIWVKLLKSVSNIYTPFFFFQNLGWGGPGPPKPKNGSVLADESHLRAWMLKDHPQLDWILKHQLNLDEFRVE